MSDLLSDIAIGKLREAAKRTIELSDPAPGHAGLGHCKMCAKGGMVDESHLCRECGERQRKTEAARGIAPDFGGAMRATRPTMLHLVPVELIRAVGEARIEGDVKYGPGNWQRGTPAFYVGCLNNAIEHLLGAAGMNPSEEDEGIETHLGHAACNIAFILWALPRGRVKREDFLNAALPAREGRTAQAAAE